MSHDWKGGKKRGQNHVQGTRQFVLLDIYCKINRVTHTITCVMNKLNKHNVKTQQCQGMHGFNVRLTRSRGAMLFLYSSMLLFYSKTDYMVVKVLQAFNPKSKIYMFEHITKTPVTMTRINKTITACCMHKL